MERKVVLARGCSVICGRCEVADTAFTRMRGLLGRRVLPPGQGLFIEPAWSVHTWFMRFPIDVVFLDRDLCVLRIAESVRPWRIAGKRGARAALELAAGTAERAGLAVGDVLLAE